MCVCVCVMCDVCVGRYVCACGVCKQRCSLGISHPFLLRSHDCTFGSS